MTTLTSPELRRHALPSRSGSTLLGMKPTGHDGAPRAVNSHGGARAGWHAHLARSKPEAAPSPRRLRPSRTSIGPLRLRSCARVTVLAACAMDERRRGKWRGRRKTQNPSPPPWPSGMCGGKWARPAAPSVAAAGTRPGRRPRVPRPGAYVVSASPRIGCPLPGGYRCLSCSAGVRWAWRGGMPPGQQWGTTVPAPLRTSRRRHNASVQRPGEMGQEGAERCAA